MSTYEATAARMVKQPAWIDRRSESAHLYISRSQHSPKKAVKMTVTMKELAQDLVNQIEAMTNRTATRNPQTAYRDFKEKLVAAAVTNVR